MKNPDSLLKSETADENPISDAFDELESIYSGRLQELEYLANTYNNAIQSLENQGYDVPAEYYEKLKDDPKFEKMIQSMTIGRINGGSPNAKYSYSWKNK